MGRIQFRDVSFRFAGRQEDSLRDISFVIQPGELVLLAGRSGSGKSTLLHCISGLIPDYYHGLVRGHLDMGEGDEDWLTVPLWQKARVTGTVFQDPRHQFFLTRVEQELMLSFSMTTLSEKEKRQQVDAVLATIGLTDKKHRLLDSLSAGEQQRVAIGAALSGAPHVLVMDEPSANLSDDGIVALVTILRNFKNQGTTIVVAEHRFSWLRELVDSLLVLDKGEVAWHGSTSRLDEPEFCRQYGLRRQTGNGTENGTENNKKSIPAKNATVKVGTLDQVGFRHQKKQDWLWRHLNLDLYGGEIVALTGRNGCGKTTLLGLLFGFYKAGEGSVSFFHKDMAKALALQHPDLQLFSQSVAGEISPFPGEQEKWLACFNLTHLRDRHPLTLSGGEMQRLVLAAAFSRVHGREKAILLLDEPTSGMDGEQLVNVSREMKALQDRGACIVVATHDRDLLEATGADCMQMGRQG